MRAFVVAGVVVGLGLGACTLSSNLDDLKGAPDAGVGGGAGATTGGTSGSSGSGGTWPGGNGGSSGSGASGGTPSGGGVGGVASSCTGCGESSCDCVPTIPSGWTAARVLETTDGSSAPCPPGYGSQLDLGTGVIDPGCGACTCGAASGGCAVKYTWWSVNVCGGTIKTGTVAIPGSCISMPTPSTAAVTLTSSAQTGSCPASSTPKPASFKVTATVCQLTDAAQACGAGACVASAVFPYPPKACVVSNGSADVACPAEYPVQYKYATGLSDSRTCVGCSCDAPSGTCSGAQVSTCNAAGCGGSCSSTNLGWCLPDRQSVRIDSVGTQGPCSPSGTATTTGSVTLSGNRTVCCVQ